MTLRGHEHRGSWPAQTRFSSSAMDSRFDEQSIRPANTPPSGHFRVQRRDISVHARDWRGEDRWRAPHLCPVSRITLVNTLRSARLRHVNQQVGRPGSPPGTGRCSSASPDACRRDHGPVLVPRYSSSASDSTMRSTSPDCGGPNPLLETYRAPSGPKRSAVGRKRPSAMMVRPPS